MSVCSVWRVCWASAALNTEVWKQRELSMLTGFLLPLPLLRLLSYRFGLFTFKARTLP